MQHKPWFDEGFLGFLNYRKHANMQWLQEPSQSNVDSLNNVRCEASRRCRNTKKEYLKANIDELETNSKIKNIRDLCKGIGDFKKGCLPRTNILRDEKSDLVTECHSIFARWRNYFSQLFSVHGVSKVRQTDIYTAERLVPEPSAFEVEMAIEKLKEHTSPGIDEIPAELIKAGGRINRCEIHKLVNSIWSKEELPEEWKESIIILVYKKGDKTDCSDYRSISLLPTMLKILSNILLSRLTPHAEEIIGVHQCGFRRNRSTTDHIFFIHQVLGEKLGIQLSSSPALYRLQESL